MKESRSFSWDNLRSFCQRFRRFCRKDKLVADETGRGQSHEGRIEHLLRFFRSGKEIQLTISRLFQVVALPRPLCHGCGFFSRRRERERGGGWEKHITDRKWVSLSLSLLSLSYSNNPWIHQDKNEQRLLIESIFSCQQEERGWRDIKGTKTAPTILLRSYDPILQYISRRISLNVIQAVTMVLPFQCRKK